MTVYILRGISGSGKSTLARRIAAENNAIIVSRDIIRQQFGATEKTVLDRDTEKLVTRIERDQMREALYRGQDVVVDDTNLNNSNARQFANLAHTMGYEFDVIDLPESDDLPLCISRSDIPARAVTAQHKKWLKRKPVEATVELIKPVEMPGDGPSAYIFDVDGTLAHIDPDNPRDVYDGSRAGEDQCHENIAHVARCLWEAGDYVYIVSGRGEEHRNITERWLANHSIEHDHLYMRPENDTRPDAQIKYEILQEIAGRHRIYGVFDDREQVVDFWRTAGIKTFDVGQGVSKF